MRPHDEPTADLLTQRMNTAREKRLDAAQYARGLIRRESAPTEAHAKDLDEAGAPKIFARLIRIAGWYFLGRRIPDWQQVGIDSAIVGLVCERIAPGTAKIRQPPGILIADDDNFFKLVG